MKLSIIIPTFEEEHHIGELLDFFDKHPAKDNFEVIVIDGGSSDRTIEIVKRHSAKLILSDRACRPVQLNLGARHAKFDVFHFVHADVQLPSSFFDDVSATLQTSDSGCFRYSFASNHPLLKINAFFTRFPMMWCRGGDQTLFIKRGLFEKLQGFDEYYEVLEDFDIIKRIKEISTFRIVPNNVIVSARKYEANSYIKVQLVNFKAFSMYRKGINPKQIRAYYKKALSMSHY